MAPNVGNPTGYWEPAEAVALNDSFLESQRSSYYDPTLIVQSDHALFDSEAARAFVTEIAGFIRSEGDDAPLLIKDPRLAALAPFWFQGAVLAGRVVRCILPVRDPRAVVASLAARDRTSFAFANVLWLKYTLLAERLSRRFPRVFVDHSATIEDWHSQVTRIEHALGFERKGRMNSAVRAFVSTELYHQNRRAGDRVTDLLPLTEMIFEQVSRAANGAPIDTGVMDRAFATFSARTRHVVATSDYLKISASAIPGQKNIARWDKLGVRIALDLLHEQRRLVDPYWDEPIGKRTPIPIGVDSGFAAR